MKLLYSVVCISITECATILSLYEVMTYIHEHTHEYIYTS